MFDRAVTEYGPAVLTIMLDTVSVVDQVKADVEAMAERVKLVCVGVTIGSDGVIVSEGIGWIVTLAAARGLSHPLILWLT
ncbi:MAG: hypothetical protein BGO59_01190 [Spirosoma sp. 48-14]|nr:MAG: hypothetical protein BGO59_01190 [Spirosoma sp. 48-14]